MCLYLLWVCGYVGVGVCACECEDVFMWVCVHVRMRVVFFVFFLFFFLFFACIITCGFARVGSSRRASGSSSGCIVVRAKVGVS